MPHVSCINKHTICTALITGQVYHPKYLMDIWISDSLEVTYGF